MHDANFSRANGRLDEKAKRDLHRAHLGTRWALLRRQRGYILCRGREAALLEMMSLQTSAVMYTTDVAKLASTTTLQLPGAEVTFTTSVMSIPRVR